tara:strand:+ start:393 stop:992 length:600 start_codon:yes stop_codon:yes gene_type:complete
LKKEIESHFLQYRGKRNYLHSTDILQQILKYFFERELKHFEIFFRKPIRNVPKVMVFKKYSSKYDKISFTSFNFIMSKVKYFGYLIITKKKILKRKEYAENLIQSKIKINRKILNIFKIKGFDFIEIVSASIMKYLKKNSPEKDKKWYFAKMYLENISYKKNNNFNRIRIKVSNLSDKIYNFELFEKKSKIGVITFIKK